MVSATLGGADRDDTCWGAHAASMGHRDQGTHGQGERAGAVASVTAHAQTLKHTRALAVQKLKLTGFQN